jgi:hypothetical protein
MKRTFNMDFNYDIDSECTIKTKQGALCKFTHKYVTLPSEIVGGITSYDIIHVHGKNEYEKFLNITQYFHYIQNIMRVNLYDENDKFTCAKIYPKFKEVNPEVIELGVFTLIDNLKALSGQRLFKFYKSNKIIGHTGDGIYFYFTDMNEIKKFVVFKAKLETVSIQRLTDAGYYDDEKIQIYHLTGQHTIQDLSFQFENCSNFCKRHLQQWINNMINNFLQINSNKVVDIQSESDPSFSSTVKVVNNELCITYYDKSRNICISSLTDQKVPEINVDEMSINEVSHTFEISYNDKSNDELNEQRLIQTKLGEVDIIINESEKNKKINSLLRSINLQKKVQINNKMFFNQNKTKPNRIKGLLEQLLEILPNNQSAIQSLNVVNELILDLKNNNNNNSNIFIYENKSPFLINNLKYDVKIIQNKILFNTGRGILRRIDNLNEDPFNEQTSNRPLTSGPLTSGPIDPVPIDYYSSSRPLSSSSIDYSSSSRPLTSGPIDYSSSSRPLTSGPIDYSSSSRPLTSGPIDYSSSSRPLTSGPIDYSSSSRPLTSGPIDYSSSSRPLTSDPIDYSSSSRPLTSGPIDYSSPFTSGPISRMDTSPYP